MQYFELYDATFDPWDLVAYISILLPLFILDQMTYERRDLDKKIEKCEQNWIKVI